MAKQDLIDWVWNNPKLLRKITQHELAYLFEFHPQRGLSIDLRRFEPDYYGAVFYPPELKKTNIDEFVHKVCRVLHQTLKKTGRADLTLTITVRHMVSEVSHWRTFFIEQHYTGKDLSPLNAKEQDWYYSLRS